MKRQILTMLLAIVSLACVAQDLKEKNESLADAFSTQSGTLIEKQFINVGTVKGVWVKVIKLKDIITEKSVSALRFEYETKTAYTSDTKVASLDSDEIDGLIKSIKALQSSVFNTTKDVYTEVTYQSRKGFQCGAYFDLPKKEWKPYVQLEKYGKSTVFISQSELSQLLFFVEEAKTKM